MKPFNTGSVDRPIVKDIIHDAYKAIKQAGGHARQYTGQGILHGLRGDVGARAASLPRSNATFIISSRLNFHHRRGSVKTMA